MKKPVNSKHQENMTGPHLIPIKFTSPKEKLSLINPFLIFHIFHEFSITFYLLFLHFHSSLSPVYHIKFSFLFF